MRILVVDDEPAVRDSLARALSLDGYQVELARDGAEALVKWRSASPDAIVLDLLMPRLDGVRLCQELRSRGDTTPVLMLTARDAVEDRVAGLDAGADDYLVKPFALEELQARLRALLRRDGSQATTVLRYADLRMELRSREVARGERRIHLTPVEFDLLRLFLEHPRQVLTRELIFERVWNYDFGGSSSALHVYAGYLRRKLEAAGEPRLLQTVRGVGYVLREE